MAVTQVSSRQWRITDDEGKLIGTVLEVGQGLDRKYVGVCGAQPLKERVTLIVATQDVMKEATAT